jgi:hypothetical protein
MKSIYNEEDASCNEVGNQLVYEAESFFKDVLERFPEYNPREMVELLSGRFGMMAARRILQMRREGVHLKGY